MPDSPEGVAQNRKQRRTLMALAKRIHRGMVREKWRTSLPENAAESFFVQSLQADEAMAKLNLHGPVDEVLNAV